MGQFDTQITKIREALDSDTSTAFTQTSSAPVVPATPSKAARVPSVPATKDADGIMVGGAAGMVLEDNAAETYGLKQSPEQNAGGRKPIALSRLANRKANRIRTTGGNPTRIKDRLEEARKNLATTDMRVNAEGEAYEKPETKIGRPAPVIAGTHPAPTRRPKGKAGKPLQGPFISAEDAANAMDPGKAEREAKRRVEFAQETERNTLLANESEINAKEEASGSTTRVKNGVTYDLADREAEAATAASSVRPTGDTYFKAKLDKQKRPVLKPGPDRETTYTVNGKSYTKTSKTWEPAGKNVAIKEQVAPSTFDADLEGITSGRSKLGKTQEDAIKNGTPYESPIPASTTPAKTKEELINAQLGPKQDNPEARIKAESSFGKSEGVSSVVSTAAELASQEGEAGLSDTSGLSTKADEANPAEYQDNYVDKRPTSPTNQAESIELDPDSEEWQAADEESTYKVIDTPRDRAENEREQSTRKAALEYEKKQKKLNRTRGPRKEKRLDAEGNVIPDEVDRGPNFKTEYEDPLDEQGNVKPAYDDPNSPNSTTMREVPVPKNLKIERLEEPVPNIGSEPDASGTAGAERGRRAQAGTDILEQGVSTQMRGPKTKVVEGRIDRVPKAVIDNGRTVPTKSGNVIPMRAFEDTSAPGGEAVTYAEVVKSADGKPLSDDERFKQAQKSTSVVPGKAKNAKKKAGVLDPGGRPTGATAGRDEYQITADAARKAKFAAKLGDDYEDTTYSKEVENTAMDMAMRPEEEGGVIKNAGDLDNPDIMTGTGMRQHRAKAFVLHKTGGISDAAEERLDTVAGGPRNSPTNITAIQGMHDDLKAEEKFHATKNPGTGITYSMDDSGDNRLDADKVHFRAKNGALVPLSEVNHPDHPLPGGKGTLEGSHIFKGGIPNPKEPGTFIAFTGHQGWHPTPGVTHPQTGKQITLLEKHSIPTGAIHEGEVIRAAVEKGKSLTQTRKDLYAGEDNDLGFEPAARSPIKGASRKKHEEITNTLVADLENSGVPAPAGPSSAWPRNSDIPAGGVTDPDAPVAPATSVIRPEGSTTAGVTVEKGDSRELASGGYIMSQGNRLPNDEEAALKTKAGKYGVKGARKIARTAAEKVKAATPKMFTPGEFVYHPKHGVGTVVSHGLVIGGTGQTTATVKFGEKEKTFTGDNIHTHVTDKQGKTTKNQELSRFTPSTRGAAVTHKQHGTGTVLGYSSNHDGSGKTHVKFDSGSTKAIADTNKLEY
jgi:hypothetical protein